MNKKFVLMTLVGLSFGLTCHPEKNPVQTARCENIASILSAYSPAIARATNMAPIIPLAKWHFLEQSIRTNNCKNLHQPFNDLGTKMGYGVVQF